MPPKKSSRVMPMVDAITDQPLVKKHVRVAIGNSGDWLYYNTSTLIRIAQERGMFMQPPYFREPATPQLIEEIEGLEGKKFVFEKPKTNVFEEGVQHHMQHFDDFVTSAHEPLHRSQAYLCPSCYELATQMYLRHLVRSGQSEMTSSEARDIETAGVDPLDVIVYVTIDLNAIRTIAFRTAREWKSHIRQAHSSQVLHEVSDDHSVRAKINTFLSYHNSTLCKRRLYHRLHGTTTRYWHADVHFNVYRYNRFIDFLNDTDVADHQSADLTIALQDPEGEFNSQRDDSDSVGGSQRKKGRALSNRCEPDTFIVEDDDDSIEGSQIYGDTGDSQTDGDDSEEDLMALAKHYEKRAAQLKKKRQRPSATSQSDDEDTTCELTTSGSSDSASASGSSDGEQASHSSSSCAESPQKQISEGTNGLTEYERAMLNYMDSKINKKNQFREESNLVQTKLRWERPDASLSSQGSEASEHSELVQTFCDNETPVSKEIKATSVPKKNCIEAYMTCKKKPKPKVPKNRVSPGVDTIKIPRNFATSPSKLIHPCTLVDEDTNETQSTNENKERDWGKMNKQSILYDSD